MWHSLRYWYWKEIAFLVNNRKGQNTVKKEKMKGEEQIETETGRVIKIGKN